MIGLLVFIFLIAALWVEEVAFMSLMIIGIWLDDWLHR